EVPVAIVPDIQLSDMVREGLDLAIRSGAGNWPGVEAELLMESRIVLVGAPALLGGRAPDPAGLAGLPWLFDPLDPRESGWLAGAGIDPEKVRRIEVGSGPTAILGAVSGYGLA